MTTPLFIPQARLEALSDAGTLEFDGAELVLAGSAARYRTIEAVRLLRAVVADAATPEIVGTVQPRARLVRELGGEILGESLLLGDAAYVVVAGVLAEPVGEFMGPTGEADPRTWEPTHPSMAGRI